MPALIDNRPNGQPPLHVWESASILRYLEKTYDSRHLLGFEDPDLDTQMNNWIFWVCVLVHRLVFVLTPFRIFLEMLIFRRIPIQARLARTHAGRPPRETPNMIQRLDDRQQFLLTVQGQLNHFYRYAETKIPLAEKRCLSLPLHLQLPLRLTPLRLCLCARARARVGTATRLSGCTKCWIRTSKGASTSSGTSSVTQTSRLSLGMPLLFFRAK